MIYILYDEYKFILNIYLYIKHIVLICVYIYVSINTININKIYKYIK